MTLSLDDLRRRYRERQEEALETVQESFPLALANELKQGLVLGAARLKRDLEQVNLPDDQRDFLYEHLLTKARDNVTRLQQNVERRFGTDTEPPEHKVSPDAHRRFERIMARLALEEGEARHRVLRDEILKAADREDLGLVQELGDVVLQESGRERFDELDPGTPLGEAADATRMALTTRDLMRAQAAQTRMDEVEQELDMVFTTVEERGAWEGPRARAQFGPRTDDFLLAPAGPEELRYRGGMEPDETEKLRRELSTTDPLNALNGVARRLEEATESENPDPDESFYARFPGGGEVVE